MLVEERLYTLQPGAVAAFFELYEQPSVREAMAPMLSNLIGYYSTEIGPLNMIVHLWRYADWAERERVRGYPLSNPVLREHIARLRPLIVKMESRLLRPSPISWMVA
jgi:hypothetical protein